MIHARLLSRSTAEGLSCGWKNVSFRQPPPPPPLVHACVLNSQASYHIPEKKTASSAQAGQGYTIHVQRGHSEHVQRASLHFALQLNARSPQEKKGIQFWALRQLCTSMPQEALSLRVQDPNIHILTKNLYNDDQ